MGARAQHLELLPPENAGLTERDEEVYMTSQALLDLKLQRAVKSESFWPEGKGKSSVRWKAQGPKRKKGDGEKGDSKGTWKGERNEGGQ